MTEKDVNVIGPLIMLESGSLRPMQDLIRDGDYFSVDRNLLLDCFKIEENYRTHIHFFRFLRDVVASKEVVDEMKKNHFRPYNLREQLLLGKEFPDVQRSFTVVSLGNIWWDYYDRGVVTALSMTYPIDGVSDRMLREYFLNQEWKRDGNFIFPAVKITKWEDPRRYINCADWWEY